MMHAFDIYLYESLEAGHIVVVVGSRLVNSSIKSISIHANAHSDLRFPPL